jgi:hypothetical protein
MPATIDPLDDEIISVISNVPDPTNDTRTFDSTPYGIAPDPGAEGYGDWLETQFPRSIIPTGTALLLRKMDITDEDAILQSQSIRAEAYLGMLGNVLYSQSRGVLGEIQTIWRFIEHMEEQMAHIYTREERMKNWSYNTYLEFRGLYKQIDVHSFPPVTHLRPIESAKAWDPLQLVISIHSRSSHHGPRPSEQGSVVPAYQRDTNRIPLKYWSL